MKAMKYARRLDTISPFRVVELLERAKALEAGGLNVVHLEVGEPDFPTADPIIEAGHAALASGATKYTQALGIPALRARIAEHYAETCGLTLAPERVVVTAGASAGLMLLSALLLDPGDELLLTDPGYPCNEVFVGLVNGVPVRIPLQADRGFQFGLDEVTDLWTPRTRGMLVASPANPTGAVLSRSMLASLSSELERRGGFLILDEIYQGLVYGEDIGYGSGLEVTQEAFVLNSFSKYFGMTGWRLGWMVVPEGAIDGVARLAQNLFISPASISQHAALAAFEPAAMAVHEARRQAFGRRMALLADGLEQLGFRLPARPRGAFYLYADVSGFGIDSLDFCWKLLEEYQVAATPGIDFGNYQAARFVRFAFTTSEAQIARGLERIAEALRDWGLA